MSFEGANMYVDKSSQENEKMSSFAARLASYIDLQTQEEWDKDCIRDLVTLEGGEIRVENFFRNIEKNENVQHMFRTDPKCFFMVFGSLSKRSFDSSEDIDVVLYNVKERQEEIIRNENERSARVSSNPYATEDEYRLGAYKESLESQVREAVFLLQRKGYSPIESGFDDAIRGSQYIGVSKTPGVDRDMILEALNRVRPSEETSLIKHRLSNIEVNESDDRIQLVLIPKDRMLPLNQWKGILYNVAYLLPDLSERTSQEYSDNGLQGITFRETQDKIRSGKNAWLRDGLAFIGGKVVEMSYQDFIDIDSK